MSSRTSPDTLVRLTTHRARPATLGGTRVQRRSLPRPGEGAGVTRGRPLPRQLPRPRAGHAPPTQNRRPKHPGPSTARNDMSISPLTQASPEAERRRLVAIGLLRASATAIILIAAYYLLPLDRLAGASLAVSLATG